MNFFDRFHLNHYFSLDSQIQTVPGINRDSFVRKWQEDLRFYKKRADDFVRDLIDFHFSVPSVFSVVNESEVYA